MIRYVFNKALMGMQRRYDYDVGYLQEILRTDLRGFLKYLGFQVMASHRGKLPAEPLFAARLRAIIWDDCGPCTQLVTTMALEARVNPERVRAIVTNDFDNLPEHTALVTRFTDLVLAHDPEADVLREHIRAQWGTRGLIAIGYAISTSRVYPALKYTLGYGRACSRVQVNEETLVPKRSAKIAHR